MRIAEGEHLSHKAKGFKCIFKSEQHSSSREMQRMAVPPFGECLDPGHSDSGCPGVTACRHQHSEGIMGIPRTWQLHSNTLSLSSLVGCQISWNMMSSATLQSTHPLADSLQSVPSSLAVQSCTSSLKDRKGCNTLVRLWIDTEHHCKEKKLGVVNTASTLLKGFILFGREVYIT